MAFDSGLALSGAGTGASVGSAFGPVGAGVGAVVGLGLGFLGQDKPDIPPPPPAVDPRMLALLEEYKQKRTSTEAGLSTDFQLGRQLLSEVQTAQLEGVARLTGGDVGAAIAGTERATSNIAGEVSKLTGTATSQAMQQTALIDRLTQAISQRAMDVATTQWSVARGEAADITKVQNQNLINALTSSGVLGGITDAASGVVDYVKKARFDATKAADISRGQFTSTPITGIDFPTFYASQQPVSPILNQLMQ